MMRSQRAVAGALLTALLVYTGCATVMDGRTAKVKLQSQPSQAQVTVLDQEGTVVAQTVTPGEVHLKRSGRWLRPARYEAIFEKAGYASARAPIDSKFNPWTLGNLVLGGGVGAVVDAATGAVWRPKHSSIEQSLAQLNGYPGPGYQTPGYPQPGFPQPGYPQPTPYAQRGDGEAYDAAVQTVSSEGADGSQTVWATGGEVR